MKIGNLNQIVLNIRSKINSSKEEEVSPEELQVLMYDKIKNISLWMNFFGGLTLLSIFITIILMLK
jgi:hypothetical protein